MAHIGLVSCVSSKLDQPAIAKEIYVSSLFKKSRAYIEKRCDKWFVLSAKYGLIVPSEQIEPYEETLNNMKMAARKEWAKRVWGALEPRLRRGDKVTFLAGERYREYLLPLVEKRGCVVEVPMRGLGIGQQLKYLEEHLMGKTNSQLDDIEIFYSLLQRLEDRLGGKRLLFDCDGRMGWPSRGIYFFFENNEMRSNSDQMRVVRIGTHAVSRGSKSTLWSRLRTHRGTARGLGNHRGSIFRLHAGHAIMARENISQCPHWGVGANAPKSIKDSERDVERKVSSYLGAMGVLWLNVPDEPGPSSQRAYLEKNLIGLLTTHVEQVDPPSSNWLGLSSPQERIRCSGLWNLDHVGRGYEPNCLRVLEMAVSATISA